MIQDMSYPRNNPTIKSVNHGICSDDFPTVWGTFDLTASLILSLPPGSLAATFDISAAYHLAPVQPDQQHHLCIFWNGFIYVDQAVMFGLASSTSMFGTIANILLAIYKATGFTPILKWVDSFFVIHLPNQTWMEQEFMDLTGYCGVLWSMKKMRPLAVIQQYIGFDWNLEFHTVALSSEKLSKELTLLETWLAPSDLLGTRHCQLTWEAGSHFMHLPPDLTFPPWYHPLRTCFQVPSGQNAHLSTVVCRPLMGAVHHQESPQQDSPGLPGSHRPSVVE